MVSRAIVFGGLVWSLEEEKEKEKEEEDEDEDEDEDEPELKPARIGAGRPLEPVAGTAALRCRCRWLTRS